MAEVKAPEEAMEKMDVNDEELKKELAKMKAEGLLDDEEEAEIVTGKVSCDMCICVCVRVCMFTYVCILYM